MNKIAQLLTAPEGYVCTGVEGTVQRIFPRSVFGSNKSVQRVLLQAPQGATIKCAIWGRDEFAYGEGSKIQISPSSQGKGLTIKDNEYKGQITKELNVGDKCGIIPIDDFSDQSEVEEVEVVATPTVTTAENETSSSASMLPAIIIQQVNLMDLCIKGAQVLRDRYPNMTDDQFQAITSSFYIESNKQNVGKSMPNQLL